MKWMPRLGGKKGQKGAWLNDCGGPGGSKGTHKAVEADPVRMGLPTRSALHLKCIKIRVLLRVTGTEIRHAIQISRC